MKIKNYQLSLENQRFSGTQSSEFQRNSRGSITNFQLGFTLLEVLISLAIVGLTLTVLIHSQLLSIRQAMKAKYHTTAIFLANEILSDTFMQENPLMRTEDGKFPVRFASGGELADEEDYPEFFWQREVENSDIDGLKKIKITVSGPENTQIILNTYRLQSNIMQTGTKR
ncbi:prepilin-type N-terminal cleavage/methylation domain-containing protein [bacterium]|nr:prepilin-type N-terminal cleavage/methylation domain-containing protein [bacterium]